MKVTETILKGCFLIEPQVHIDNRGFFLESFNQKKFEELTGLKINFVQDNISFSKKGVIRAIHMQKEPFAQAKLVQVLSGKVLDIAIDMRENSETYKKVYSVILSSENKKQLFIPKGFLHGFAALEDSVFAYKVDNYFQKDAEFGVRYDDETFGIDWILNEDEIIVSEKDKNLQKLDKI